MGLTWKWIVCHTTPNLLSVAFRNLDSLLDIKISSKCDDTGVPWLEFDGVVRCSS